MSLLTDLPNELLIEVLALLENSDIDSLYAIPQLARRLEGFVCLVSDTDSPFFKNLRHVIGVDEFTPSENLPMTHQAVVELHDFGNESTHQMVPVQAVASRLTVSIFTKKTHVDITERYCLFFQQLSVRVRAITFEDLTDLTLRCVNIDTERLKLPHVQKLRLESTWVNTPGKKLFAPVLEHLTVEDTFRDVNECLDYKFMSNLKRLSLLSICDMDSWSDVSSSSLEHVEIDDSSFRWIEKLELERLITFTIDTTAISRFASMSLPKLYFLVIFNAETKISISNLNVPSLKTLYIRASEISKIEDICCSSLAEASLGQTQGELLLCDNENVDTSIFETVSTLKIENCSEMLNHTPHLEKLTLNSPFVSSDHALPALTELSIGILCAHRIRELPQALFQGLQTVRLSDTSMVEDIDYIQSLAPNLQELVIDDHSCNRLIHRHVSNIQKFKVHSFGQLESHTLRDVHLDKCHFVHLKEFHACYMCMSGPYFPSEFNFTAPELERIVIQGLDVPHLDLSGFPKLKSVVATGGVKKITLGKCDNLEFLDLSDNKDLCCVEAGALNKLAYLKCDGTEYFLNSPLDAPLLAQYQSCR